MLVEADVMKVIEKMYGPDGKKIIELLLKADNGKTIDEIAQETGIRVNDVRRLLYEMSQEGFVAYLRSQKGDSLWYNYRWYTNTTMLRNALSKRIENVIKVLEERLEYETGTSFYICPNDLSIYTFEEAFENNFQCIHCQADLVEFDNRQIITHLKELLKMLKKYNSLTS
ncbi:MAG: helix-turn-helix domain-containing protein [archaeon YNP-WB-062]|jgi:transcription initiation factor TFIIE subunit alpha|nr:helix-turn-helix domain-containing protein [Candidatus Culexarchaeum yellowstonense]